MKHFTPLDHLRFVTELKEETGHSMCTSICLIGVFFTPILQFLTAASARPGTAPAAIFFPYPKQQNHLISQCSSLALETSPFIPGRPRSPFEPETPGIPGHPWRMASRSASPSPTILTSEKWRQSLWRLLGLWNILERESNPLKLRNNAIKSN